MSSIHVLAVVSILVIASAIPFPPPSSRGGQGRPPSLGGGSPGGGRKVHHNCGAGTVFHEDKMQCIGEHVKLLKTLPNNCPVDDASCWCDWAGYGSRGPKFTAHPLDCTKYISCLHSPTEVVETKVTTCEAGYAFDEVGQVCGFGDTVKCGLRSAANVQALDTSLAQCLSEIGQNPVCGCGTYKFNSLSYVPERCYEAADAPFTCTKENIVRNNLSIGIGDGIRPGVKPDEDTETVVGQGYHDAPWLVSPENPDGEYPYNFPVDKTAVIMIDFQRDFVCPGGFGATLGNDVEVLQQALQPARDVLKAARALGMPVIHTLESHQSDLSDLKDNKYNRGELPSFLRIGEELDLGRILVRGSCGNNIVDMVAPIPGEYLVFKPGKTAFYNTHFEDLLQELGITHIIVAGVTTEVCMQSTVREATDRGYEPLIITDATRSYFERYRQGTIEQLVAQGALVAWAAKSTAILKALEKACVAE